jgi:hypothetical protein
MPNATKDQFLKDLKSKFGSIKKLPGSLSLYELEGRNVLIYIRYSKIHSLNQAFYGLRAEDLKKLEASNSVICFLWDSQVKPIFIPFSDYEEIFSQVSPASDGQFKAQIYLGKESLEFYLANAGRFNIDAYSGWEQLENIVDKSQMTTFPELSHSKIQTFIGTIGFLKGFDVWIPSYDRNKIDIELDKTFRFRDSLPERYSKVRDVIQEIDVIWIKKGSSDFTAMFEVEHSTPIYSGLLRFNDLHLVEPRLNARFNIVSNELRRSLFIKQVTRPTFKSSGLSEICNFLEYKDVYLWYNNIKKGNVD